MTEPTAVAIPHCTRTVVRRAAVEPDGTYPASPVEQLFRVGTVLGNGATSTGSMECGSWLLGPDGNPCFGTLGVLVDNVFGAAVLAHRPPGQWATTTEISLTFCSPLPTDRQRVEATAELDHLDPTGGVAHGRVSTSDGRLIAVGTQRTRFAAGHPAGVVGRPVPPAPDERLRIADLLGVDDSLVDSDPLLSVRPGSAVTNPAGNLHGGVNLCLSEMAGLRAAQSPTVTFRTSSIQIAFIRPAPVGLLRFSTDIVYRGRTLVVVRVSCLRPDGKACAVSTVTCHAADAAEGQRGGPHPSTAGAGR